MIKVESTKLLTFVNENVVCREVQVGRGTVIRNFVNLYECIISSGQVGAISATTLATICRKSFAVMRNWATRKFPDGYGKKRIRA